MSLEFRTSPPILFTTPTFVTILRDSGLFPEDRVSTRNTIDANKLPAARVTIITPGSGLDEWTRAVAQIDLWAPTDFDAGALAAEVASYWRTISQGVVDDVFVEVAWVEQPPRPVDEPDLEAARYLMLVGLVLSPEGTTHG